MKANRLLIPLAITAVIGLGACRDEAGYDSAAGETADPAATEPAVATQSMDPAADPAMQMPPTTEPQPTDDAGTMAYAGQVPAPAPDLIALDANNDGALSMDELPANDPWRNQFASADGNGDGLLSQAEIDVHASATPPPPPVDQ